MASVHFEQSGVCTLFKKRRGEKESKHAVVTQCHHLSYSVEVLQTHSITQSLMISGSTACLPPLRAAIHVQLTHTGTGISCSSCLATLVTPR
jgi:hypothetical protein